MSLPEVLYKIRSQIGISQSEASRRSGVSSRLISYWEVGRGEPRFLDAIKLARAYGVSLDDMADMIAGKEAHP